MFVRRTVAAALVAGGAALAVAVPATMARASTGYFEYFNLDYPFRHVLVDEPNYQCTQIQTDRNSGPVFNGTDSYALLFETSNCTGYPQLVGPGEAAFLRGPYAGSVSFRATAG